MTIKSTNCRKEKGGLQMTDESQVVISNIAKGAFVLVQKYENACKSQCK